MITMVSGAARWLAPGAAALVILTGCVQTTTGARPAESNDDNAAQQYFQLGARYFRNGNYELARERLHRAIGFDPRMAIAHSTLALTYEQLDNERLATEHHAKAVRFEPGNYNVRNAYAVFLCRHERYDEAAQQFKYAVAVPENDNAEIMLTNAGVCMSKKPDYEQAEAFFRQALEKRSGYGEALLQMSLLKYRTSEYLQARAFVQRFLAVRPATSEALYLAVQIEKALGDERAQLDYANRLLREFPESEQARQVLQAG
ncbi:MAG: type IV pilus biogenesis/stability protein PilW [Woeseia sp.]